MPEPKTAKALAVSAVSGSAAVTVRDGLLLMALTACGAGNSSPPPMSAHKPMSTSPSTYTIGGAVAGLTDSDRVLQDNAGDDLAVSASGSFTFTSAVANGAPYAVTVK